MSLRLQLLLLSLLTLLLPWAGCHYAREMETMLREGEQQALLATATTLASVVASQPELMPAADGSRASFDFTKGDLYVYRLHTAPLLDGYSDDWNLPDAAFSTVKAADGKLSVRYVAGTDEHNLYLLMEVADRSVALEQTTDARLEPEKRSDHVWLAAQTADGKEHRYLFATSAPGLISARRPTTSEFGEPGEQTEPRVQAWWQPDHNGYRLEIRIPLAMAGVRFGFQAVDIGKPADNTTPARAGTLNPTTQQPVGRLMLPATALEDRLAMLLPPSTHVLVSNREGWVFAEAGALALGRTGYEDLAPAEWLQSLYRRMLESGRSDPPTQPKLPGRIAGPHATEALAGRNGAALFRLRDEHRQILAVATPVRSNADRMGALVLEQTGERLLVLRDRALTRLLNLTLLASGIVVLATLAFATILAIRLGRMKRAAETALERDGKLNAVIPETQAKDELGDMARSFDTLLKRLHEYTSYLRTLAGKLSHELRTPLAIVQSSLENIESEAREKSDYLIRAREGTSRLQAIVTAMGAATRTEEAIQHAERVDFDLAQLVSSTTQAYAATFKDRRFEARLPDTACLFRGAPDLIVQMLDKLVDNAVDFSAPDSTVRIELAAHFSSTTLTVTNEGPPIPESLRARLFEPMFELRRHDPNHKPHFGLGLYIVRLIAEFHGGEVIIDNLSAPAAAVRIGVRLPMSIRD